MKHWKTQSKKDAQYYRDEKVTSGIILSAGDYSHSKILSVAKKENGDFDFMEECDNAFSFSYTKKEALELVEELKQWIINN